MANERIGYRKAVARQPESLANGLSVAAAALQLIDMEPFRGRSIGFAGIGASYQAAMVGASYLRDLGIASFAYCPTDLYGSVDSAAEAFVALSASGQSREISEVMERRSHLPRLAICRSGDNPLSTLVGRIVPSGSGADNGASSTGYTGMLLAIGLVCDKLAGQTFSGWGSLSETIRQVLESSAAVAAEAAELLRSCSSIDLVGGGCGFATAGEGAMLIREAVRIPAAGWDTMNYLHGPMESQDSRTGVIAFGNGREMKIAADMAGFGCPSVLITSNKDAPRQDKLKVITVPALGNPVADAIVDIVALQMVVGEMQDAAGLTDITFRYRQTDTKLKPWSPTEV